MKARLGIALPLCASLLAPALAHAAWSADPVTVHATTDLCPLVAAASDAQDGAIVVWQQNDAANPGVFHLLAKRVLANGDLDAAWPVGGATVSSATVGRTALGALGDGSGGAYVWWMESASLYLTRVLSDGTLAAGWPARGRSLSTLMDYRFRPLVLADGAGGIWLGWLAPGADLPFGRVTHLGPDGLGAGGWPDGGRSYAVSTHTDEAWRLTVAFTFAPAGDGGAWIAWGDAPADSTGFLAGSWRLLRTAATGLVAPGWDAAGLPVGAYHVELLINPPLYGAPFAASPMAVCPDGGDGVYLLLSDVTDAGGGLTSTPLLFHLDAAGSPDPSWPAAGVEPGWSGFNEARDCGADCSLRLFPETAGGVFAMRPFFFTEGIVGVELVRLTATGAQTGWADVDFPAGLEWIVPPSGDTYLASCWPYGPYQSHDPSAFIRLEQTSAAGVEGPGLFEWHRDILLTWYGDVGLAPTSGAGAIFVWSQVHERQGVFARRFTQAGQVTGVAPAGPAMGPLRLRFAPGRGVVATLGAVAGGSLRLFDVSGRVCGRADVPSGACEVTLAGTAPLAPGLYFARHLGSDGTVETGRVLVVR
jgi:hypothetical protein